MALILIVEDSEDDLAFMAKFVQSFGHECRLASSGFEAMALLSVEKFDLILSDYMMENGDGLWLIKEMKQLEETVPCIIITADRSVSSDYLLSEGVSGICYKPIVWFQLKSEMDRLLGVHSCL